MKNVFVNFSILILTVCLGFGFMSKADERKIEEKKSQVKEFTKQESVSFLIGAGVRQYKYTEPGVVVHEGVLFDLWGEWYWTSAIGNGKLYGNILYGSLTYDGSLCDLSKNCRPYTSSTTDVIARVNSRLEYNLSKSFYVFGGAGYRFLYDRGDGSGFYTRTGNWVYLPLGGVFKYGKMSLDLEYDLIVYGSFRSNLSEAVSEYSDLVHTQKGYGLLLTAGYQLNASWGLYAAYELWDLDETDPETTANASFVEPKNNSQSFELKIGYSF